MKKRQVLQRLEILQRIKQKSCERKGSEDFKILRYKMSLCAIADALCEADPREIAIIMKELVSEGTIETNIEEFDINPIDAYFICKNKKN